jgi:D-alanyl-D-alanine dipeptidase
MKALFNLLFLLSIGVFASSAAAKEPDAFASSMQMVVVTTPDWSSPQAVLQRFERERRGKRWKAAGGLITVVVGKTGLAWGSGVLPIEVRVRSATDPLKKEGDGKAPAGVFRLSKIFGYALQERPGWKMPYLNLTSSIQCVDDTDSKFYNQLVDASRISPDWGSHENEKMLRSDDLYRWGVIVEHNTNPALPGKGSCIFMHIWRGPGQPTVGCTAMPQADLEALLGWLDAARKPLLVQMPETQYIKLRKYWHLPALSHTASAKGSTMQPKAKSAANDKP